LDISPYIYKAFFLTPLPFRTDLTLP
jgi:hypothetical protein